MVDGRLQPNFWKNMLILCQVVLSLKIERYYVISMEDKYSSDSLLHFATQKPYSISKEE